MTRLAERKGELISMMPDGRGRVRLEYRIPARGLIGFRTEYLTATAGTGLLYHIFDGYAPRAKGEIGQRTNGALVSMVQGKAVAYTLFDLQERGSLFIGHGVEVYEGMIIGIHSRDNDLMVNPTKGKQLTNIRSAGRRREDHLVSADPLLARAGARVHRRRRARRGHAGERPPAQEAADRERAQARVAQSRGRLAASSRARARRVEPVEPLDRDAQAAAR